MKGENLRNEWARRERVGRHPVGKSELETLKGLMEVWTGDKKERKGLSDVRNEEERELPWKPR